MEGTRVVCRSVRRRMMREIYSSHSSRHTAQNALGALNSLTQCSVAWVGNGIAPDPTLWLMPSSPPAEVQDSQYFLPVYSSLSAVGMSTNSHTHFSLGCQ